MLIPRSTFKAVLGTHQRVAWRGVLRLQLMSPPRRRPPRCVFLPPLGPSQSPEGFLDPRLEIAQREPVYIAPKLSTDVLSPVDVSKVKRKVKHLNHRFIASSLTTCSRSLLVERRPKQSSVPMRRRTENPSKLDPRDREKMMATTTPSSPTAVKRATNERNSATRPRLAQPRPHSRQFIPLATPLPPLAGDGHTPTRRARPSGVVI